MITRKALLIHFFIYKFQVVTCMLLSWIVLNSSRSNKSSKSSISYINRTVRLQILSMELFSVVPQNIGVKGQYLKVDIVYALGGCFASSRNKDFILLIKTL